MADPDREKVLRERAERVGEKLAILIIDRYAGRTFADDYAGDDLILAALRQTEEEARATADEALQEAIELWMAECAKARAEGERAGREAERAAIVLAAEAREAVGGRLMAGEIRSRSSEGKK